jgi:hypothetical protein
MSLRTSNLRRRLTRLVAPVAALALMAAPVSACPYCSLSQGTDTLVYVLAFLTIPYVIVYGTWRWMKHVLNQEALDQAVEAADGPGASGDAGR